MVKITKEISNKIKDLYLNHTTISDIIQETGLTRDRVTKHLKELGVYKKYGAKYVQDDYFFNVIDAEKKAYWLGVLYADGCVRSPSQVIFSSIDKDWVEIFKNDIGSDRKIYREFHKTHQKEIWKIAIHSHQLYQDLCKHGCVDRKSKVIRMPNIPKELRRHFIRGYFDGDGSASFTHSSKKNKYRTLRTKFFSGSKEFLEDICKELTTPTPTIGWHSNGKSGGVWQFELGPNNSLTLYDFFYKNATTWLNRKKEIFELYRNVKYILSEWDDYTDDEKVFILQRARETLRDYNRPPERVKG